MRSGIIMEKQFVRMKSNICLYCAITPMRSAHPVLWFVTWEPSQPTATRPLAIQKDGTWLGEGVVDLVGDRLLNANFDFNLIHFLSVETTLS